MTAWKEKQVKSASEPQGRPVPAAAQRVGGVGDNGDAAERLLKRGSGGKAPPLGPGESGEAAAVAGNPGKVHRDDRLGARGDGRFQRVLVHGEPPRSAVDQDRDSSDMADHTAGGGIGIGGSSTSSPSDSQKAQDQLGRRRLGGKADRPVRTAEIRDGPFKAGGDRAGGNPPRAQNCRRCSGVLFGQVGG